MPDLPTVNLPAGQRKKVIDLFGSEEAYVEWLKGQIRGLAVKRARSDARREAVDSVKADLPGIAAPEPVAEPVEVPVETPVEA